jgi:TonB family protein
MVLAPSSTRRALRKKTLVCVLSFAAFELVSATSWAQQARPPAEVPRPKLTKAPALLEFVEAPYPDAEKAAGRAAQVVLQLAITATGDVEEAAVVESAGPYFDQAALEAVKKFKFSPAEFDGQPAPVKITYRYQFTLKVELPTTSEFRGVVRAKGTGAPLAGVTVELDGVGSAQTNELGEFVFAEVAPGVHKVSLSREDLTPLGTEETFEAGQKVEAQYDVELPPEEVPEEEKDDFEIVIQAPRLVKQVVSTEVSADEARRVPGTQGDVLKVVENLPGVARASAGSGEVVVWGAAPEDTRTYVGAVRVPLLYHFGGLRSVVHTDLVRSVELIPGGYGASYGRGLGGLVFVEQKSPSFERTRGSVQADLLDASAALNLPLGEKTGVQVAARRSHIGDLAELLGDHSYESYFTIPDYYDAQARFRHAFTERESVEVGGMLSGDVQKRTQPSSDPAQRVSETRELQFQRFDVAYKKELDDGAEVRVAPWFGFDRSSRVGEFGSTPTSIETRSTLVGFRSEWRGRLEEQVTARAGFDVEVVSSRVERSGSITSPPREGDAYVFGRPPSDQVNYDDWKTTVASVAPYAELDYAPFGETLHVTPGLRVEPYYVGVNRRRPMDPNLPDTGAHQSDVSVQPRLALRYSPEEGITFKGAFGIYSQPPLSDDLSAVFGNPLLGLSHGTHYLAGASYRLFTDYTVETTGFYTRSKELAVRSPSEAAKVGEALVQEGEGRSLGAQFLLRRDKGEGRFFGWVAYTILRSERRSSEESSWRLFDYDQTHVLTALASYDIGLGVELGVRARVASGYPRTPVLGSYYDASKNRYEPELGAYNTERIPTFYQFDARAAKRFRLGEGSEVEAYLDVQNVTNRENPEEVAYAPDYSSKRYITGLPILPVLGAKWSF